MIILIPGVLAYVCPEDTAITKVPCEMVTPDDIQFVNNCTEGNYNYTIIDLNTSENVQNGSMDLKFGTTYNFTFNQSLTGHSYKVKICDFSYQIVNVNIDETSNWEFGLILILSGIALCFAFLSTSINSENWPIKLLFLLSSILLLVGNNALMSIIIKGTSILSSVQKNNILNNLDTTYKMLIFILIFIVSYIGLMMLYTALKSFYENKKEKQEGEENE
jgi:hypothetical protein